MHLHRERKDALVRTVAEHLTGKLRCMTDDPRPIYQTFASLLPASPTMSEGFKTKLTALIKESPAYKEESMPLSLTSGAGLLQEALKATGAHMAPSEDRLVVDFTTGSARLEPKEAVATWLQETYDHQASRPKTYVERTEHVEPVSLGRSA